MNEEQLIKEFREFQKFKELHTKVDSTNTQQLLHGPGGLLSERGLNPEVFSAMLSPRGLGAELAKHATQYTMPLYPILTGQEDDQGAEPSASCGDPVKAGFKKLCTISAAFGKVQRATDTIDPIEIITLVNRGEFNDHRLLGTAGMGFQTGWNPGLGIEPSQILNNVVANALHGVAVSFVRKLSKMIWNGTVAGNTDGYAEFPGLESQVTTGITDINGTACPAVDSDIKSFNFDLVGGSGRDIIEYMEMLEYYITYNANKSGLEGVEWVWVMRPELWKELSTVWPIAYNTLPAAYLNTAGASRINVDGADMMDRRDAMRSSHMITVNGTDYRVVTDDGITELTNTNNANIPSGEYASDIYFVPLRANGIDVTRIEYLNYRMISNQLQVLGTAANLNFWTNDGMYLWDKRDYNSRCFQIAGVVQPRVVLQTPQIAGRIQNVRYQPLQHLRQSFPDDPYFVNGGVSTQPIDTVNQVWN